MPEIHKDAYVGSCNPSRQAKQTRADNPGQQKTVAASPSLPRNVLPILPKRPNVDSPRDGDTLGGVAQPGTAKRGRKPGPLSRSARETQRKLNHSIIEKARRTKINDALATLRLLVPPDYGSPKNIPVDDDQGDWEGEATRGEKEKSKTKAASKREEKEKEFKLEILVRTVSFMQDLISQVKSLEASAGNCSTCGSSKRKRNQLDDGADHRGDNFEKRPHKRSDDQATRGTPKEQHSFSTEEIPSRPYIGSRLPSISSWLLDSQIDPHLLSPTQRRPPDHISQLPSPPSSTYFHPIQPSHVPPVLNLGSTSPLSPARTPEDESAASLLLQIGASSPQPLPISTSIPSTSFNMSKMRTSCVTPVAHRPSELVQAQTPGSMLGMTRRG